MDNKTKILALIEKCGYKGKYVTAIKKSGYWDFIESEVSISGISDTEKIFLFFNPAVKTQCRGNKNLTFKSFLTGFKQYCKHTDCAECKEDRKQSVKDAVLAKYGVDNVGKLDSAKNGRYKFWNDKTAVDTACLKRKNTNKEKYGFENVFQNENIKNIIKCTMTEKYGVDNPSKSATIKEKKIKTCLTNYGVEYGQQSPVIQEKTINTTLAKYGVEFPMQSEVVKNKMMATKISHGSFTKSNSSLEATLYFRDYIVLKEYDLSQVAFSDSENGLYEWGYKFDKWYLYDFVAFELGNRGNPDKIIEIIEYHGPFHYTENDVLNRGTYKAVPWKSNKMTIAESYETDRKKEFYAKEHFTTSYTIIWSPKWHK